MVMIFIVPSNKCLHTKHTNKLGTKKKKKARQFQEQASIFSIDLKNKFL